MDNIMNEVYMEFLRGVHVVDISKKYNISCSRLRAVLRGMQNEARDTIKDNINIDKVGDTPIITLLDNRTTNIFNAINRLETTGIYTLDDLYMLTTDYTALMRKIPNLGIQSLNKIMRVLEDNNYKINRSRIMNIFTSYDYGIIEDVQYSVLHYPKNINELYRRKEIRKALFINKNFSDFIHTDLIDNELLYHMESIKLNTDSMKKVKKFMDMYLNNIWL